MWAGWVGEIKYGLIKSKEKTPGVVVCPPLTYMCGLGGWVDEIKYGLIKSRGETPGVVVCPPFTQMRGSGRWDQ